MQKVIEFRGEALRGRSAEQAMPSPPLEPKSIPSVSEVFDSLSRILDRIRNLCESVPDGPIREQLEAERATLIAKLVAVRTTAAQISLPQVSTTGSTHRNRLDALRAILPAASSQVTP